MRLRFRGQFRSYQQRVLERADHLLSDRHLHIVAAPGSGKTILGLEMICRLQAPALVLAPTLAIRDQWISRFCEHFEIISEDGHAVTDPASLRQLTSISLLQPNFLTVVTYQTLWAAMTRVRDEETGEDFTGAPEVVASLLAGGLGTICMDEAHHLRSAWQRSLTDFLDQLRGSGSGANAAAANSSGAPLLHFLALTATPPYDSTPQQWRNYLETCGPIDEEISIPELVATGDLCPHQDYVYLTYPSREETAALTALARPYNAAFGRLLDDGLAPALVQQLGQTVGENDAAVQSCMDDEEGFISFLQTCASAGLPIPSVLENVGFAAFTERATTLEGTSSTVMDLHQSAGFILNHPELFNDSTWEASVAVLVEHRLAHRRGEALTMGQAPEKDQQRILNQSISRFTAIGDIVRSEITAMGAQLRQVILTDYIRADALTDLGGTTAPSQQGAVPTVVALQQALTQSHPAWVEKLALLTGSLVLVPQGTVLAVMETGEQLFKARWKPPSTRPVGGGFTRLDFPASTSQSVPTLTALFSAGKVQIMVGTAALLGEGWDAPALNSLIIASSVKTFMLSNQLRGRAIRIDAKQPEKVANIWHLLTLEAPPARNALQRFVGQFGEDYHGVRSLAQRMRTNVGLALLTLPPLSNGEDFGRAGAHERQRLAGGDSQFGHKQSNAQPLPAAPDRLGPQLDSGLARCFRLPLEDAISRPVEANRTSLAYSRARALIKDSWKRALATNFTQGSYAPRLRVQTQMRSPKATLVNVLDVLIALLTLALLLIVDILSRPTYSTSHGFSTLVLVLISCAGLSLIALTWWQRRNLYRFKRRHRLQAQAILEALIDSDQVTSPAVSVMVDTAGVGATVQLKNATLAEELLFAQAVTEVSLPPRNPRYLVVPKRRLGFALPVFAQAVPSAFSRNRESVDTYVSRLNHAGLPVKAVYTRHEDGRRLLLNARRFALTHVIKGVVRVQRR